MRKAVCYRGYLRDHNDYSSYPGPIPTSLHSRLCKEDFQLTHVIQCDETFNGKMSLHRVNVVRTYGACGSVQGCPPVVVTETDLLSLTITGRVESFQLLNI